MPSLFNGTLSSLLEESPCSPDFAVKTFLMEKVSDQSHFPKKVVLPKIDNCFHCCHTLPTLDKDHHINHKS